MCIALAVYIKSAYAAIVGALILLSMVLSKRTAVTEKGIEVTYDMVLFKRIDLWSFDEIKEIHKELSPAGTRYALHMMKDIMSKRLVFPIKEKRRCPDKQFRQRFFYSEPGKRQNIT